MERKILQPEQILVPFEYELGNEDILKIYFRIFNKGSGDYMPPVIVVKPEIGQDRALVKKWYGEKSDRLYECLDKLQSANEGLYYLLDGNHKGVAATLCHAPIQALEIKKDNDLDELESLVETGELFNLPGWPSDYYSDHTKISSIIIRFEEGHISEDIMTLRDRVDKLTSNGDLPKYMKERYLQKA